VHVLRDPASIVITQLFTIRTSDFKAHMKATKSALAPGAKNRAPSPTVSLHSFAFHFGSQRTCVMCRAKFGHQQCIRNSHWKSRIAAE
jgi:hypothetical protein